MSSNTPLTSDESAALKASTSALYLYGEVFYIDAFGHSHVTRSSVLLPTISLPWDRTKTSKTPKVIA